MPSDELWLREGLVLGSVLVYWIGVFLQTFRIRRRIGRSPNVRPRGLKERLLWLGWTVVVGGWMGQPFLIGRPGIPLVSLIPLLMHPWVMFIGTLMVAGGYAGTLWCYVALGDAWRLGIRRHEKTMFVKNGPYRFVRHPIYFLQIVMLIGSALLLPTLWSFLLVGVHFFCVCVKAFDEEAYLKRVHGPEYAAYLSKTGRFWRA